ncbi:MAG: hypothetical protein WA183_03105, partial [Chthoniobacterales bacterium]
MPFNPNIPFARQPSTSGQPYVRPGADADANSVEDFGDDITPFVLDGLVFPRAVSRTIAAMPPAEFEQWKKDRIRAKVDALYLAEILEFDMCAEPHELLFKQLIPMQYPAPDISQLTTRTGKKKTMILWPRGVFKTSGTIISIIQIFLSYPNSRVLFLTSTLDLAKQQLARIVAHFEIGAKPRFKYLFPEYCYTERQNRKTKEWEIHQDALGSAKSFNLPCRTNMTFAEKSFTLATPLSGKTGSHYDFIFIDDLVNENTVDNDQMLEKSYRQYTRIVPVLEPGGLIVMSGTRYHFADAYARIQEQAAKAGELSTWQFSIKSCWVSRCLNCQCSSAWHDEQVNILQPPCIKCGDKCPGFKSDGSVGSIFPLTPARNGRQVGQSVQMYQAIRAEVGPQEFANQYENSPLASEYTTFTETLIGASTLHDINQIPNYSSGTTFIVGDLADSADSGDNSVMYVCRSWQGRLYVFHCVFGKFGSPQLIDAIIGIVRDPRSRPHAVYFEKTLGSGHLDGLLTARMTALGLPLIPITWVKSGNVKGSKDRRIRNIAEGFTSKRLWLFAGMPGYQDLVGELCRFPRTKHDDFADALGRV